MINRRQFVVSGLVATTGACRKKPFPGSQGYAFVANGEGQVLTVVQLSRFAVAGHIPLGDAPVSVLPNPRRSSSSFVLTGAKGKLLETSADYMTVTRYVRTGSPALSMQLAPDCSKIWVLCADRKLLAVDLGSFRIVSELSLPADPTDFDLSRENGLAAVSYGQIGSVSQFVLADGKAAQKQKVSDAVGIVRYRSDGKTLLVANTSGRMLTVLNSPGGEIVTHLPLAVRPDTFCFNKNEGQLFITGEGRDAVVVVYPYFVPQVAETVLAGSRPGAMAASNNLLFVANPQAGAVSIMNIERRKVVAVTSVGAEPSFVAITPDDEYVLVLNRQSGDMAVLRVKAIAPDKRKSAGLFWMVPVGSKPLSAAVSI